MNLDKPNTEITIRKDIPNQLWELYKSSLVGIDRVFDLVKSNQKVEMIVKIEENIYYI